MTSSHSSDTYVLMQLQLTNKSPEQRLQMIREKADCDIGELPTYDRDFKERQTLKNYLYYFSSRRLDLIWQPSSSY